MKLRVVLVEPKYEGNVGSVARVMKNLGFNGLVLVNPVKLGGESRGVASHAMDVLDNARIVSSLADAIADANIIIGTTALHGLTDNNYIRMPFWSPAELRGKLMDKKGSCSPTFRQGGFWIEQRRYREM